MDRTLRHVAVLVLASTLTFFTTLGGARLWDRDEPRNAGCAEEMLARGDWVTPVFNAELRTHKPVLIYWFIMSAYQVFDDREFAARFWSAALGIGTVLMTYAIGRRLFNAAAGLWAGLVLCSTIMFTLAARVATPDSVLIFFVTAAMLAFVYGAFKPRPVGADDDAIAPPEPRDPETWFTPSWAAAALVYALMGVAVLAKGPVGLVLPTGVIGMFLLVMGLPPAVPPATGPWWRRAVAAAGRAFAPAHFLRTAWLMRPVTALVVAGLVAVPWYFMVGQRTGGDWLRGFFLEHNLGRATQAMEGHGGSLLTYPLTIVGFYPVAILVGFFPWSVLIVAVLIDLVARFRRRGEPWRAGYVFAACWVGVWVAVFSIPRTKLPTYITPMYPGLSLIAGAFLYQWARGMNIPGPKAVTDALRVFPWIAVVLIVGGAYGANELFGDFAWALPIGAVLLAGAVPTWLLARRGRTAAAARAYAVTAVVSVTMMFGYGAVMLDRHQQADRLLAAVHAESASPDIATFRRLEPSWVYYSGQTLEWYKDVPATVEFLRDPNHFILTSDEHYKVLKPQLPEGVKVLAEVPYFTRKGRTVMALGLDDGNDPAPAGASTQATASGR